MAHLSRPGVFTLDYHRAHPQVTTDEHVDACRIQLGRDVKEKRKIYLDTCFWILLRDALLERNTRRELTELYEKLHEGSHRGALICPISATTFLEIYKQQDPETRRATVTLVDELSRGVTLVDHFERANTELAYLLHTIIGRTELHDLDHLVWNRLSFVLGVTHPSERHFPEEEERAIRKALFDHMWSMPMISLEEHLAGKQFPAMDYDGIAERLNAQNAVYASECKSFEQLYRNEFMGGIEASAPVALSVMEKWYAKATGRQGAFTQSLAKDTQNMLLSILSRAVKKNDFRRILRTAHIGAICHAAFRWDKQRKMNGNWLHDFHHAEAAVGYCDMFLTEKPLADLLRQRPSMIEDVFPCQIISSPVEAVRALSEAND
jgi:hypothetical protein